MTEFIDCCKGWHFSFDGADWSKADLPHVAFPEPEVVAAPRIGTCFYRYHISAPAEWQNKIVSFEIGAAMQKTIVRVNGEYQFTHWGGYNTFYIPLSEVLRFGEDNLLELELDNAPGKDMAPGKVVDGLDFCYYSGLHRGARLLVREQIHISEPLEVSIRAGGGFFLRTLDANEEHAHLEGTCHVMFETHPKDWSQIRKEPASVTLQARLLDPNGNCVSQEAATAEIAPNLDHTFQLHFAVAEPDLWSPENPALYHVELTLLRDKQVLETRTIAYGIRTIEFRMDGFYLNGEKVFLNGTNRHSEFPFIGNAVPRNAQRRDVVLLKKYGFNFVRLSHYPQSPDFMDACDELGLMVMPPIAGWQAYHPNSTFIENTLRDCRELVRSLRNRPGVILWESSLNESYPPAWFNRRMHEVIHEEYPGPFCYTAGDTWGRFEEWDVLFSCDYLKNAKKPQLLREYGDWAFGGGNSTSRRRRSDALKDRLIQAWNFIWSLNRLRTVPGMVGCADWVFCDYNRGCAMHDSHPDQERSGSLDIYRLPKIKAEFYRSQGDDEPMVSAVHAGDKLIVFSNCSEVEVSCNGKILAKQGPDAGPDTPYGATGSPGWETALPDNLDLTGGDPFNGGNTANLVHPPFTFRDIPAPTSSAPLVIRGLIRNEEAAVTHLRVPGKIVKVQTRIRTEGIPLEPGDVVFVDAILRDEAGDIVPETVPVVLKIYGTAKILGGMPKTEAGIASFLVKITGKEYYMEADRI